MFHAQYDVPARRAQGRRVSNEPNRYVVEVFSTRELRVEVEHNFVTRVCQCIRAILG